MSSVTVYSKKGEKLPATITLPKEVFAVDVTDHNALKYAYTAYLSNGRSSHAKALSRGEVRGGGRKPWKQKGTGRARFGSSRVPQWRGGGIVHGPTGLENHIKPLNRTTRRTALKQALSLANAEKRIKILDDVTGLSGKTAELHTLLGKIEATGNILLVVEHITPEIERAARNMPNVIVSHANYLNTYNLINADVIVCSRAAIDTITDWLKETK